jgi:hypothetical protein
MMRRFTVIQGGLPEASTAVPAAGATTARRLDRFAAETVEAAVVGAGRSVRVGNATRDPRRGADHRMPSAQHRPTVRGAGLAWIRDTGTEPDGWSGAAIPLGPISLRNARAEAGQPTGCAATAAAETAVARAADRALRARLAVLRGPIRLVGSAELVQAAAAARSASAAGAAVRPRVVPAGAFIGTRPQGWAPPASGMPAVNVPRGCGTGEPAPGLATPMAAQSSIAEPAKTPATGAGPSRIGLSGGTRTGLLGRAGAAIAKALRLGAAGLPWRRLS